MLAVLWLVPLILFSCALTYGWKATWTAAGIPWFAPPFLDLRVITSGLVALRHGGDPLVSNPFDPLGRKLKTENRAARLEMKPAMDLQALEVAGSSSLCEFPAYFSRVIWRRPDFSHAKFKCCSAQFFGRSVATCIF